VYGSPPLRRLTCLLLLPAAGFILPFVLPQYFLYLGNFLMMFAVLAIGLDLLLGWAGQFAFAHVAFFGVGVYTTALLQSWLGGGYGGLQLTVYSLILMAVILYRPAGLIGVLTDIRDRVLNTWTHSNEVRLDG